MPHKITFLVDDKVKDAAAVGMLVGWVKEQTGCETSVVQVNVDRWHKERMLGARWLSRVEIRTMGLGGQQSALAVSIEHIRQMAITDLKTFIESMHKGYVGYYGSWCGLCWHYGRNDAKHLMDGIGWERPEITECLLNQECRGGCCDEWQRLSAATNFAELENTPTMKHKTQEWVKLEAEYRGAVKALFKKLVLAQLDGSSILLLVGSCWETLYKLRISLYVTSVISQLYVCGVSLSDVEKPLTELPDFTIHTPGPDFKDGLIYDIKEVLDGKKEKSKCSGNGESDSKSADGRSGTQSVNGVEDTVAKACGGTS